MSFKKALPESDVPEGAVKKILVQGKAICIYRLSDGFFATDAICSHRHAPLAEGEILDDTDIECPRHGARFNIRTGEVRSLPATAGLRTYPVRSEKGYLYIDVEHT